MLRIGEIAARAQNPERVIGTHWFNPPHLIPLVEVVQADDTSPTVVAWMIAILTQAGKVPVHIGKDTPGFVGNRIQHAMWREAISLVDEGVCDAATADLVVRNSFGLRLGAMGPLENADYVGLDLTLAVHEYLFPTVPRTFQRTIYRPSELMIRPSNITEIGNMPTPANSNRLMIRPSMVGTAAPQIVRRPRS